MSASSSTLVLVAGSASALDSAAIISVGTALAPWQTQHGLGSWQVGALSATLTICIAAGALVGGRLADTRGRAGVFTGSVAAYAVACLVIAAAPGFGVLLGGLAVLGLASGADLPASLALVADHAPPTARARLIATTHVMWTVGIVLASAAGLAVAPWGAEGVHALFVGLSVCAFVALWGRRSSTILSAVAHSERHGRSSQGRERLSVRDFVRQRHLVRTLRLLTAYYSVYTLVANTFGSFRTYLLITVGGATQVRATAISFGLTVVGLAGTIVFSRLVGGAMRDRAFAAGACALVGSQLLAVWAVGSSFGLVLLSLLVYALAYPYAGEGIYKVWTQETFPAPYRASAQGVSLAAARVTAAGFALVTPRLIEAEPRVLFLLLACFAATSALLGRRLRTRPDGPSSTGVCD